MKYEEYEAKINEAANNPDNAPIIYKEILEAVLRDTAAIDEMIEKNKENEKRIRDLQDTNMKLFLAQTAPRQQEEEKEELTGDAYVDDFFKEVEV